MFFILVNILLFGSAICSPGLSTRLELIKDRAWTLCLDSLWNSCVGRCGQALYGPPYLCACDHHCRAYKDCCLDFEYECTLDLRSDDPDKWNLIHTGRMSCVGLATNMEYGVLMVSSCASWWPKDIAFIDQLKNTTKAKCLAPDPSSLVPVISVRTGTIYKNVDCATCNGVRDTEPWAVVIKCSNDSQTNEWHLIDWLYSCKIELDFDGLKSSKARACAYNDGECPVSNSKEVDTNVGERNVTTALELTSEAEKCTAYSKPIIVSNNRHNQSSIIYKNVHCAQCNGHSFSKLYCPNWELHPIANKGPLDMTRTIYYEVGVSANTRSKLPNLPASFSILFYFHFDGHQMTMFSSHDDWSNPCEDNQIWDPFWDTCRSIYCTSQFTLVDYHCESNNNNNSSNGFDITNSTYSNITQLDNVDVSQVMLVLHVVMQVDINATIETVLAKEFVKTLAHTLNVTSSRFTNYTSYNESFANDTYTNAEVVSVMLLGPSTPLEPSIGKIVGTMAYGVSLDQFFLQLNSSGLLLKIRGIQEKIVQLSNSTSENGTTPAYDWCPNGRQIVYQNDQFTPVVQPYSGHNTSLTIYVNSTGVTYLPGQFIANILMEGPQSSSTVNVSGVVVVCDERSNNNSCLRWLIGPKDYIALPNGSIECVVNSSGVSGVYRPDDYEILPNGDALICIAVTLPTIPSPGTYHRMRVDIRAQSYLTTILLSVSSTAILATIVTYLSFRPLRNLPGLTILNLCLSLLAFQLLYLGGMRFSVYLRRDLCKWVAVFLHWTILAAFFWMNVVAFDLYWTFSHMMTSPSGRPGAKTTIVYYALYSYGCSTAVVLTCFLLDQAGLVEIGYGEGGWCWIGNPVALGVAFAGVVGTILLVNGVFYVLTVRCIRQVASKAKMVTGYGASRNQLSIYARISTVMGFGWGLGYLEGVPTLPYVLHDIFAYAFIVTNCLSGLFIFIAFVCNRKAVLLYKECHFSRWLSRRWSKTVGSHHCDECKQPTDNCTCQKTVSRTISNETRQSLVLDDDQVNDVDTKD